jgi:hypothetical protein
MYRHENMMSQSLEDIAEARESPVEIPEIDQQIASLLSEIEQEHIPDKLLALAEQLQTALVKKRQRSRN